MFEIFIALFGALYYGGKLGKERIAVKKCQKDSEKRARDDSEMRPKVMAPPELENEIHVLVYSKENYDKIYDTLSDNLEAVFGDSYREKFIIEDFDTRKAMRFPPITNAYYTEALLLSKMGKIGHDNYVWGYKVGGPEQLETRLKLLQQIEKNLQDSGFTEAKLFVSPSRPECYNKADYPAGESFVLEHMLGPWNNAQKDKYRLW